MKTLFLIFFVCLYSLCYGQLVFEINQSTSFNGVYPCISANSNWNSPNLLVNGNWFSDTLRIADDGIIGSACSTLNSNASGNFALAYRTGCDLRQTLLNIQNSGANGALIIDSVAGRPLPFFDSVDTNITMPFIIISRDIGDSLFSELTTSTNIIVSFGDKTSTTVNDVGIYKETSWWSMYGCFPFESLTLQDTLWGSWVYNHGTDTASNLQLKFYFELNNGIINYYDEVNSLPFNIPPLDSIYIPLLLSYNHTQWTTFDNDTMRYGYQLLNAIDSDTLDNKIESYILSTGDILSHSYQREYQNQNAKDYTIQLGNFFEVYQRYEVIDSDVWGYLNFILNIPLDSPGGGSISTDLFIYNGDSINNVSQIPSSSFLDFTSLNMNNYTIVPFSECIDLDYLTMSNPSNYFNIILSYLYEISSPGVLFTSDMYHDLRHESDSAFLAFLEQGNPAVLIPFDVRLTPTHYVQVIHSEGPYCASSLPEKNITVSISPNPSSEKIHISSSSKIKEISIINIRGEIISTQMAKVHYEIIDISSLTEGMYIILIENEGGVKVQKKFVKQ